MARPPSNHPDDLVAALDGLLRLTSALREMLAHRIEAPLAELLTSAEFAGRLKSVTAPTVEEWCRTRRFGKFARAERWGRAGWRIPAYYLYYTDAQWDLVMQGRSVGNAETAQAVAATDAEPRCRPRPVGLEGSRVPGRRGG
jgi:hypothetical protein